MEILCELGSLPHFDYNLGENFWEVEPCGQANVVTNIYDRPLKAYTRKRRRVIRDFGWGVSSRREWCWAGVGEWWRGEGCLAHEEV